MFAEPVSSSALAGSDEVLSGDLRDAVLDAMDSGVILCDAAGKVTFSNLSARQELGTERLLRISAGRLHAPCAEGRLSSALADAARRGVRHVVELRSSADRIFAVVLPMRDSAGGCTVAVFIGRRTGSSELSLELLGISAGLTGAERRVLADLASQQKPTRIAKSRQVTISTVRTQIASLYAKLGVRSQQELLCLVGGVPPLAVKLFASETRHHY